MVGALLHHLGQDGPGHHVAGQELVDEALAGRVAQQRAVAAQRLRQQRPGHDAAGASAVGWNWKNSRSATATPARSAMATPSPVASRGLVVTANSWPAPPVASSTLRARIVRAAVRADAPPPRRSGRPRRPGRRAKACSCTTEAVRCTACTRARSISAPVATPACTTRATEWPPSRASSRLPRLVAVELRAQGDELLHPARPFVHQHPHRVEVAQAGAGGQRVGQVEVDLLRVLRRARRPRRPGPTGWWSARASPLVSTPVTRSCVAGGTHGGGQPGHAAAQHQEVELVVGHRRAPARRRPRVVTAGRHPRVVTRGVVDGEVVDEPGPAEAHRAEQAGPAVGPVERRQRDRVDHVDVVELAGGGRTGWCRP